MKPSVEDLIWLTFSENLRCRYGVAVGMDGELSGKKEMRSEKYERVLSQSNWIQLIRWKSIEFNWLGENQLEGDEI